jgi:hypothetical protein
MMNKSKNTANNKNKTKRQRKRNNKKGNNYSFLNFSNSGDILSQGIGKTRAAPVASGRALATSKPRFSTRNENTFVCHSEFIGNISQMINFSVIDYPINPGLVQSFTWLSSVAPNYERFRFRRLRFRYEVLSSTNTTGKVFFVPNFNVQDPPPENKQEALSYEYAVGSQPWIQFGVDVPERYLKTYNEYFVRTGALDQFADLKTFDPLTLYICTEGSTSDNLNVGEFWIDYEIELINPVGQQMVNNYLSLYNNSLLRSLQNNSGIAFGSNSQFPLGASGQDASTAGALPINVYPNDTGNGSVIFFKQPFVGFIFMQWGFYNTAVISTATWPPTINYSTVQNLGGGSIAWSFYTDVISSGNTFIQIATYIIAAAGSQIDFSLLSGANANSIQSSILVLSPSWLSPTPPVYPSLKKKESGADLLKKMLTPNDKGKEENN